MNGLPPPSDPENWGIKLHVAMTHFMTAKSDVIVN
jgi:hypothetical protein